MRRYDKPITIEKLNQATDEWVELFKLHARINNTKLDNRNVIGGAVRVGDYVTFEVRYFKLLEQLREHLQLYTVVYNGRRYQLQEYDDYMESHVTVKLQGIA